LPTIYAKTDRLVLRGIEKSELPRLVSLLNIWDIARWLVVLPYPYTLQHAEEFYADMDLAEATGEPQFYGISLKSNPLLIGGVGLHPPRGNTSNKGDVEIGYWLGFLGTRLHERSRS
jgi:RimJ/RimL family protein N-acetyltransferase